MNGPDEYDDTARRPPQDIEAERAVLGSCMLDAEGAYLAVQALVPDDFYRSAHRKIFGEIIALCDAGTDPDQLLVRDRIEAAGSAEEIGGLDYLHECATSVPSSANVERYAAIVKQMAMRRRLITACTATLREIEDGTPSDEVVARAQARFAEVESATESEQPEDLGAILQSAISEIEGRRNDPDAPGPLQTGLLRLDDLTGGLHPSELTVVGGATSVGKTALVLTFVDHVSCNSDPQPSLLFSLEMSKKQIAVRHICMRTGVPYRNIEQGYLRNGEWDLVVEASARVSEAPVYVHDDSAVSISRVRAYSRYMKAKKGVSLVVVDHLHEFEMGKPEHERQEIGKIVKGAKHLAKELDVPVILVSQLRKHGADFRERPPTMADLFGAAAIQQHADCVFLLYRPYRADGTRDTKTALSVAKQRNGPTGKVDLVYRPERMKFADYHPDPVHAAMPGLADSEAPGPANGGRFRD